MNFVDDLNCSPNLKDEKSTNMQVQALLDTWKLGNFHVSVEKGNHTNFVQWLSPLIYMIEQINELQYLLYTGKSINERNSIFCLVVGKLCVRKSLIIQTCSYSFMRRTKSLNLE